MIILYKSIYNDVERAFRSYCIYYLGNCESNIGIFNVDYTKICTLNELLDIFNKDKENNKEFYDKYFDRNGVIDFLQYYEKAYNIWEICNGDLSLLFSILFGIMCEIFHGQEEERKFSILKESGSIEKVEKKYVIKLKGVKEHLEDYAHILKHPAFTQYKYIARFLYRSEEFHIEDYVKDSSSFKLYTYKPDYILVGLALNRYAHKIGESNTSKIIERKNNDRFFDYNTTLQ